MNKRKGGKNETIITNIILGRNCFDSAFMADVAFWARNRFNKMFDKLDYNPQYIINNLNQLLELV